MSQSSPCFVAKIDLALKDKLENDLLEQGFSLSNPPHTFFSAKKPGVSCTLYQSGKLTVQGKNKSEFITFYLEPQILKDVSFTYPEVGADPSSRIGLDEAGKGDFFGPLCVAGCFAPEGGVEKMIKMGVKDSKQMSDRTILTLSKAIKESFPYKILRFFPETYNRLYTKFNNLNRMLGWAHATALEELSKITNCTSAILDQFADERLMQNMLKQKNLSIDLKQRFKGEEDPVVAAASILARAAFLEGLEELEKTHGVSLPKGASAAVVTAGKKAVVLQGKEILPKIAKTHFKTTQTVLYA